MTLSHLVLDGRDVLTSGMSLTNVNIVLDHIIIRDLTGNDGSSLDSPHGDDVVGLSLPGVGSLEAFDLQIQRLAAGNGLTNVAGDWSSPYRGGNATGVAVSGTHNISIGSSYITDLTAGDAGDADRNAYSCSGEGGHAVGIETLSSDVNLDAIEIHNLQGGAPCSGYALYCVDETGTYVGVMLDGGQLTLTNSTINDLHAYAGYGSRTNSAVQAQNAVAGQYSKPAH